MSDNSKLIVFKGRIVRCTYNTENFKIYAVDVDKNKYPNIKLTKYSNAIIKGDIHSLAEGQEYEITASELHDNRGYSYKIVNIKRDKPNSDIDMQIFLAKILTPNQAQELYNAYPDIVDRVINNRLEDVDLTKTKGIKEYTFNLIKEKIIENFCLVDLVGEFQGLLSLPMLKKLYTTYPSVQTIRNKMKSEPYKCLCRLSGVGFKTADALLLEIDQQSKENVSYGKKSIIEFEFNLKNSKQRCMACIQYLLEENQDSGNTKMDIVTLKNQCVKMVPACANFFVECMKDESIYYNIECREVGLKSIYNIEKYIGERVLDGLIQCRNKWNFQTSKYKNVGGFESTEEQIEALHKLCIHDFSILNGNAGTGKTQTTNMIIQMLLDNGKSFRLFAPTGKAAKVLAEYTRQPASTIHRGLGYIPPNDWQINEFNKLNCDVLIVDEFSMSDIFLFKRILDAIDFNRTKLLLIGDDAQLPSVACGNLLYDFIFSGTIPTTTLTKVFRYGAGGLMTVATDVRECKKYLDEDDNSPIVFFGGNKDYSFINTDSSQIVKNTVALYKKLLSQGYTPSDIQVLTAYNKGDYGSIALNNHIQRIANCNYGNTDSLKFGETTFYVGDIVIQKINNYKAKVYVDNAFSLNEDDMPEAFIANGETGVVLEIGYHNMVVDFDGVKVIYSRDELQGVGLGYSISIHKSQGSSSKIVILLTPQAHTYMLNSNLIYVGLTRMKERCFHLGSSHTVNVAIKKKENFNRETFLRDILKESKTA